MTTSQIETVSQPNPIAGKQQSFMPLVATTGSLMLGGSSTFLLNLFKALGRRGYYFPIVILSDRVEHSVEFAQAKSELLALTGPDLIYEDRLAWGYKQVARFRPQAVLACLSSDSFEVLRSVPASVVRLGIIQSDDPGPYRLVKEYRPWLDGFVGVSTQICDHIRSLPESDGLRIEYIPYGIDFPTAVSRSARSADAPLRVVYLGRIIEEQKRISRLIRLVKLLEQRNANVAFTIVGDGPDAVQTRTALSECPTVNFRGTILNTEVPGLLREQDVFILLSDFEGLPLSLLEAMAEGVVPVVSDLRSGMRQIVGPEAGFRFPIGDVDAAAQILLALSNDRALLAKRSAAAAKLAREHYHADRMAEQYLHLISELADGGEPPVWPCEIRVPAPRVARPWLYDGWPRKARRFLKKTIYRFKSR
jgi:glycosyltransferase involved in cell wall biosynthesis